MAGDATIDALVHRAHGVVREITRRGVAGCTGRLRGVGRRRDRNVARRQCRRQLVVAEGRRCGVAAATVSRRQRVLRVVRRRPRIAPGTRAARHHADVGRSLVAGDAAGDRTRHPMNRFEDRVDRTVAQLPAGQRVVSPIVDDQLRVDPLTHMVDRACVGHCFSYANYEPSTAQFRIRALMPNPYVIADYGDSWELQNGRYVVRQSDLPMFALGVSPGGEVTVRGLDAGAATGTFLWNVLQNRLEK